MSTRTAIKKAFGARFRAVRLERELTYQAAAKLLGISVPMILKYERGFSFPHGGDADPDVPATRGQPGRPPWVERVRDQAPPPGGRIAPEAAVAAP